MEFGRHSNRSIQREEGWGESLLQVSLGKGNTKIPGQCREVTGRMYRGMASEKTRQIYCGNLEGLWFS